jgi:hypothetical protein
MTSCNSLCYWKLNLAFVLLQSRKVNSRLKNVHWMSTCDFTLYLTCLRPTCSCYPSIANYLPSSPPHPQLPACLMSCLPSVCLPTDNQTACLPAFLPSYLSTYLPTYPLYLTLTTDLPTTGCTYLFCDPITFVNVRCKKARVCFEEAVLEQLRVEKPAMSKKDLRTEATARYGLRFA